MNQIKCKTFEPKKRAKLIKTNGICKSLRAYARNMIRCAKKNEKFDMFSSAEDASCRVWKQLKKFHGFTRQSRFSQAEVAQG